jgi:peptide-methionine (S)-S-oxide reductase
MPVKWSGTSALVALLIVSLSCTARAELNAAAPKPNTDLPAPQDNEKTRTAIFGMGCFWCSVGIFEQFKGVVSAQAGYAGGTAETATYDKYELSNHAESVKITYDPRQITYAQLLQILFSVGDATTKDGQAPDFGHQYRIAVFYETDDQKKVAEAYIKQLTDAKVFDKPIAVTVEDMPHGFFPAEEYHQEFVKKNPNQPYVRSCSLPKMQKAREMFKDWLKEN